MTVNLGVLTILVSFASAEALGYPVELWECRDSRSEDWSSILAYAAVDEGKEKGVIEAFGEKHFTDFITRGNQRRWDYGLNSDNNFDYAFMIEPNGDAKYYDFTHISEAIPSLILKCRKIK